MFVFCTSCGGQNKPDLSKSETKDAPTSRWDYTNYEYIDANDKSLIIQNSLPKGGVTHTGLNGKVYNYRIFFTRIINGTGNPLELTIDFPLDSFELPSSPGNYIKLLLPSDTMTLDKKPLYDYGLAVKSFLDNRLHKPSSLKRTINPKESNGFYVVMLCIKPRLGWNGTIRSGLSLKGQNLFYTVNGKEILCGSINLKNLMLQK